MKKVIISAALFTVMGANVWAANNDVRDGVKGSVKASVETSVKSGVYNLIYRTANAGPVRVTITNEFGTVVLVDQIYAEGSFYRPYNFVGLPEGAYTLTIVDRNGKTSLPLVHSQGTVSRPLVQIKPVENKKYELTMLGSSADVVQVNIFDSSQNLIFSDQILQKGSFTRVYDLNKLRADNVTFEVTNTNGEVSKMRF